MAEPPSMYANRALPDDLAARLRLGHVHRVQPQELDAILGWVTHARREPAATLAAALGSPESDPELLRSVYEQMDRILFRDQRLLEEAAGVAPPLPEPQRRSRYRRLMAAFHPDRYPGVDLADWLTPRSQAIHRSYARFRRGEAPEPLVVARPTPSPTMASHPAKRRHLPKVSFGPGLLHLLRDRTRGVHHLEAKILGVLAIVSFLPVLILYLNQYSAPVGSQGLVVAAPVSEPESGRTWAPTGQPDPGAGPGLIRRDTVAAGPLETMDPVVEVLATTSEAERIAARDSIARLMAAREIAEIETAAMESAERRLEARGRETIGSDAGPASTTPEPEPIPGVLKDKGQVGENDRVSVAPDPRAVPTLEPDPLDTATRELALLEAAVRRAEEREAVALEAAMRETAVLEQAMQEAAALKAEVRHAAAREAAARQTAGRPLNTGAAVESGAPHSGPEQGPAPRQATERPAPMLDSPLWWPAGRDAAPAVAEPVIASPLQLTDAQAIEIGERRVKALLDSYQSEFRHGDIVGLMRHLGPEPHENGQRGRHWFEASFTALFESSRWRKLNLDIETIKPADDGSWEVGGQFFLRVDYMDRPTLQASGPVRYRVSNRREGWRIDSIEY